MLRRALTVVLSILVILALVGGGAVAAFTRVLPPKSFPQVDGELRVAGLEQAVDVYRDPLGVAHIYAATTHDLFFAQGYVHAQERFWQMDFWRHIGSGRLSEMFGKAQLDTDIFLRRMGWARVAKEELARMDPESKAILEAYAAGVNAYLKDHAGTALSLEYGVLKLLAPGYQVEPWEPLHSLTWAKAMAWDLRGNMDEEGERAVLLKLFSRAEVEELYPDYDAAKPTIVSSEQGAVNREEVERAALDDLGGVYGAVGEQQAAIHARLAALDELLGPGGTGFGSNNWVLSGALTATGMPLLANDPHLGPQMPSIWYEVGLHCQPKGAACPLDLVGFSFASAPGVVIGHNDRIAWGFTNVGPDVQDIYIEKINPAQPNQYEVNGAWVDMDTYDETIQVAGGEAVTITVRSTRHGPILWEDAEAIAEFDEKSGLALPEQYRLSLRWTALDPSSTFPALWKINKAQNWEDFRAAAADWDVPAQNFVYADVEGNIGYQMPGRVPIRAAGDGWTYVPGWTDEYEWQGYIPFDELPRAYNPPEGFIATANNAVVDAGYPYLIGADWDAGYRATRIVEMIRSAPGPIDAAYIQKMQGDNQNLSLVFMLPALRAALDGANLPPPGAQARAWALLQSWDGQQNMDSNAAALYQSFWRELLRLTFHDDLPEDFWPSGGSRWWAVMENIIAQPQSKWWDNRATPAVEGRDEILRQAFAAGLAELEKLQGKDPARWSWGDLHTITFRNQSLGESGVAPLEALLNRGPFPTAGGEAIVNATGWDAVDGFQVDWLPSMRMIVDLGDFERSLSVHTTGQSGHAFHPHYADMVDLWRTIQYHPMRYAADGIQSSAEAHLRLTP